MNVARIDHVVVLVDDLSNALAFYETVLGCTVEGRFPSYGMVELRAGESHIDLVDVAVPEGSWARPPVGGGRNVDHVALAIQSHDPEAVRKHLSAANVAIMEERVEDRSVSFYVRDPSRNTIELIVPSQ